MAALPWLVAMLLFASIPESWQQVGYGNRPPANQGYGSYDDDESDTVSCADLNPNLSDLVSGGTTVPTSPYTMDQLNAADHTQLSTQQVYQGVYDHYTLCFWFKGQMVAVRLLSDTNPGTSVDEVELLVEILDDMGTVLISKWNGGSLDTVVVSPPKSKEVLLQWVHMCLVVDTMASTEHLTVYWYGKNSQELAFATADLTGALLDPLRLVYDEDQEVMGTTFHPLTEGAMFNNFNIWRKAMSDKRVRHLMLSCANCGNVYCSQKASATFFGMISSGMPSFCLTKRDRKKQCENPATALEVEQTTGYGNQERSSLRNGNGYGYQQSGYDNQNGGYGSQQSGYGDQNGGYGNQNTGYGSQLSGFGNQNGGFGVQRSGYGNQNNGYGF